MNNVLSILTAISVVGASAVASAEQDDEWVDESADESADLTPAKPPAPAAPAPVATATRTDHDQTIGAWGFQIADAPTFAAAELDPTVPPTPLQMVGVRKWGTREAGWEAGVIFGFAQLGADPEPTRTVFGGTFGYLKTLGIYKHVVVFYEPQAALIAVVDNDGIDGTDDPTKLLLQGRLSVGAEVRLGMIGIPTVGLTTKLSAGLEISNDGDESDFSIGTQGGVGNSVRGLVRANVGFIFYIP